MIYRDFYKNKQMTAGDFKSLIPEGITPKSFARAVTLENRQLNDISIAANIVSRNLKKDVNYYKKLYEGYDEEEIDVEDEPIVEPGNEYDDNDGLPKIGGALAVPHVGQPIMMGKIIQVGNEFGGKSASGEQSGMTAVQSPGDKEPITAGGKKVDCGIATKSVGGEVVPGEGQKQGGLNSHGTIASTAKLNENKKRILKATKEILKEIRFDKATRKWVRIDETVDMKIGKSYKTIQPRQYKVSDDDTARTNQYEPEITEMYDSEEECEMNERYVALANSQRNLSEAELSELKSLREKIDRIAENNKKWIQKAVKHPGRCAHMGSPECPKGSPQYNLAKRFKSGDIHKDNVSEDGERSDYDIASTETHPNDYKKCPKCGKQNYMCSCPSKHGEEEGDFGHDGFSGKEVDENDGYEHPDDAHERQQFQHGINSYNRRNKQRYECPTCKTPNALSADDKRKGYQCNACANAEEGAFQENVDMEMGPSYKVVQPRQYKVSDDDTARTNQYEPQVSENNNKLNLSFKNEQNFIKRVFFEIDKLSPIDKKQLLAVSKMENPSEENLEFLDGKSPLYDGSENEEFDFGGWFDLVPKYFEQHDIQEAGRGAVQHSSYRTTTHGNLPQDPKTRWENDVDEGKTSKVAKTIAKGQKSKKSTFNQSLKHHKPKKVSSGVHKRKA